MNYLFYGININTPLSTFHNTGDWDNSVIGKLSKQTNRQIYIREIPSEYIHRSTPPKYGWRVVDAYFSQEDSLMTYFRAYGLEGEYLGQAVFGVNYGGVPHQIGGGFAYPPESGRGYYVPVNPEFMTPNTGGYTVQVLDLNYPSEGLSFGMYKQGKQHQCLVVSFRLFQLGEGYPNDSQQAEIIPTDFFSAPSTERISDFGDVWHREANPVGDLAQMVEEKVDLY